ncbi:MAG: CHAD domain-containing protein [Lysobacter sp.]|nr:CHAD domain-containing protein [Lysobacter sp.]
MAYRLSHKDDSVQDAVRRIVRQQIHDVVRRIDDPSANREETIHEIRKTCKKLRALLRLVRPVFPDARKENAALRDIARSVSMVRDATTLVGSFDRVLAAYGTQLDRQAADAIRTRLLHQRDTMLAAADIAAGLAACRADLLALEWRSCDWKLEKDGADALRPGLRKAYRKARYAMLDARNTPTAEHLHAWRKRAKDHWYHARLFSPVWKEPMEAHVKAAHDLGSLLGDHHDLTVFLAALAQRPDAFGTDADAEVLAGLTRSLQDVLEVQAFSDGARLFAESPPALADSWIARYETWRDEASAHAEALQRALGDDA